MPLRSYDEVQSEVVLLNVFEVIDYLPGIPVCRVLAFGASGHMLPLVTGSHDLHSGFGSTNRVCVLNRAVRIARTSS